MKKTICFLTCVLMAVLVPVTGMALGGNAVYSSALEAMETHLSSTGISGMILWKRVRRWRTYMRMTCRKAHRKPSFSDVYQQTNVGVVLSV